MRTLYVLEQGARVAKEGQRIVVKVEDTKLEDVRAEELAQVVVMGNVGISAPAVQTLLKSGSEFVWLSRSGRFLGRLSSGLSKNVALRHAQHTHLSENDARLELAKIVVGGKIDNQVRLMRRHQSRNRDEQVAAAIGRMRSVRETIDAASDHDEVRGVEGAAAAAYFGALGRLISAPGVVFEKRMRRPPPDPVNILLSFGYTLLGNVVHAVVETAGLDPYLGALHDIRYGRPSLVLDIMEEFRPVVVDTTVLRAFNTKALVPADFLRVADEGAAAEEEMARIEAERRDALEEAAERAGGHTPPERAGGDRGGSSRGDPRQPDRPVIITRAGVKKWLACFERRLDDLVFHAARRQRLPLREVIRAQVYLVAGHIEGGGKYVPFTYVG